MSQETNDQTQRVTGIEQKLALLDYRLTSSEAILTEIKDAIKELVILNQQHKELQNDVAAIQRQIDRNIVPDLDDTKKLANMFYGGAAVVVFLISILAYIATGSLSDLESVKAHTARQETQITLLERDFQYYHSLHTKSEKSYNVGTVESRQ